MIRSGRADDARAFLLSVIVHAVLLSLLVFGLMFADKEDPRQKAIGSSVSAELVDAGDLSPAMQQTLRGDPSPPAAEVGTSTRTEEDVVADVAVEPSPPTTLPTPQPTPVPVPAPTPSPAIKAAQEQAATKHKWLSEFN